MPEARRLMPEPPALYCSHGKILRPQESFSQKLRLISSRVVYRGPVFSSPPTTSRNPAEYGHAATSSITPAPSSCWQSTTPGHAARSAGAAIPPCRQRLSMGTARRPHRSRRTGTAGRKARTAGGNRLYRRQMEAHPEVLCQPRLRRRNHGGLSGHRPARRQAQPEADEIIYKRLVPLPTVVRMVLSGTIRDAKTISSVLWLEHMSRATGTKKR